MLLRKFANLPCEMQNEVVRGYYDLLIPKQAEFFVKRVLDFLLALLLLILTLPLMLIISMVVRSDSPGGALFCQTRRMRYNKEFVIYKFRTMSMDCPSGGSVTTRNDPRVTRIGKFLRSSHLDELPQLFNVLRGELSFVGPRPEVPYFVARYDEAMLATLLIPAGITSPATLLFANEADLLDGTESERIYIDLLMPRKASLNLDYLCEFSLLGDLRIMALTTLRIFFSRS
ncbi:MAG: sugar transferase [Oscillospiraceae bacterium]